MLEEVSMEKQKDQEFAHLEVKRLCGVFGAPLPPVEEKPVDKVKEPPRPYRSRGREERGQRNAAALSIFMSWCPRRSRR